MNSSRRASSLITGRLATGDEVVGINHSNRKLLCLHTQIYSSGILWPVTTRGSPNTLSPAELGAWQGLLRATAQLHRLLDADLKRSHHLSGSEYDVLIQLGLAPHRRLRMTTLAEEVLMSPSGLTRLVDQLVRDGLLVRKRREDDSRSFDAVLTPTGRARLKAANRTHLQRVRELFLDRLSDVQLQQLADIWNAVDPKLIAGNPRESSASVHSDGPDGAAGMPDRDASNWM